MARDAVGGRIVFVACRSRTSNHVCVCVCPPTTVILKSLTRLEQTPPPSVFNVMPGLLASLVVGVFVCCWMGASYYFSPQNSRLRAKVKHIINIAMGGIDRTRLREVNMEQSHQPQPEQTTQYDESAKQSVSSEAGVPDMRHISSRQS